MVYKDFDPSESRETNRIAIERVNKLIEERMRLRAKLERNEKVLSKLLEDFGFSYYTIQVMLGNEKSPLIEYASIINRELQDNETEL